MRKLAQGHTKTAKNVVIKINFVIDKNVYIMYNDDGLDYIGQNNFVEKLYKRRKNERDKKS